MNPQKKKKKSEILWSKVLPIKDGEFGKVPGPIFEPTKKSEILWSKVLPIKEFVNLSKSQDWAN